MTSAFMYKAMLVLSLSWFALTGTTAEPHTASQPNSSLVQIPSSELHSRYIVPREVFAQWNRVAWCETHADWTRNKTRFDGGLGISRVVWVEYGGLDYAPAPHLATPYEQVAVAVRIQHGLPVPDADGCSAW